MQRLATLSLADITSPDVLAFHQYWLSIRGDAAMPAKSAFDATAIRHLLPYITLEELHYVKKEPDGQLYSIGSAIFALSTGRFRFSSP